MDETVSRRPYVREVPRASWYLRQPRYVRYMAREATCVFIGAYSALMVLALERLSRGVAAWDAFLVSLRGTGCTLFLALTLAFSLYHSITWFNLTPRAMPVQVGESFLPGYLIAGAHYVVWALVSLVVLAGAGVY